MNHENIGILITTNKLNEKNYLLWSTVIRIFLRANGKENHTMQSSPMTQVLMIGLVKILKSWLGCGKIWSHWLAPILCS